MAGYWLLPFFAVQLHSLFGWTLNLLIYFTMCWTVGIVTARILEFPMLRLRDRLFPGLRVVRLS